MVDKTEVERNLEAYRRMKDDLDRTYPLRECVAIAGERAAGLLDQEEVVGKLWVVNEGRIRIRPETTE